VGDARRSFLCATRVATMAPTDNKASRTTRPDQARDPDSEVRRYLQRPLSELRNRKDTSKFMILVPLLDPKFATVVAAKSCELRVRGTRAACAVRSPLAASGL